FIVFGIVYAAGFIPRDIGPLQADPWTPADIRALGITFAASLAALLVNPFGYRLVFYPFDLVFRQKLNVGMVEEWASVNFNYQRAVYVLIVLAVIFFTALAPRRKWRIDDLLLVAFALYGGLKHIRMLMPAGLVLPPILAPQLADLSSYDPARERRA